MDKSPIYRVLRGKWRPPENVFLTHQKHKDQEDELFDAKIESILKLEKTNRPRYEKPKPKKRRIKEKPLYAISENSLKMGHKSVIVEKQKSEFEKTAKSENLSEESFEVDQLKNAHGYVHTPCFWQNVI